MADLTPDDGAEFIRAVDRMYAAMDAINQWASGPANGGPNGDGYYPLPNSSDQYQLAIGPQALAARIPTGQPTGFIIGCFADVSILRAGNRVGWTRMLGSFKLTGVRAWLASPDKSPTGTGGIEMDVLLGNQSIFSGTRLKVLPGQTSSRAQGTPQPQIGITDFPDDAMVSVNLLSYGVQAQGLRVAFEGHYA